MDVADFDYELPRELIAQEAVEPRDAARLLVLRGAEGSALRARAGGATSGAPAPEHRQVRDLPALLEPGDLLVVNDARVEPARLVARRPSGGRVELLLLLGSDPGVEHPGALRALVGASRVPPPGERLALAEGYEATLLARPDGEGAAPLVIEGPGPLSALLEAAGRLPLPPYIRRRDDDPRHARDRERYQTLFAERPGALAAPTAGLHFTPELLARLAECGVGLARLTLLVGEGTFRTPEAERVEEIRLHGERFALGEQTARRIAETRAAGGRVVAVGTTVVRTLESRAEASFGGPEPGEGDTELFIAPGHRFRFVDALMTNFHLPRSSLVMLVAAFAGRQRVLEAYRLAVAERYRFYSYGDAMLVLP